MSYVSENHYTPFTKDIKPYSMFSFFKDARQPIVPSIKKHDGSELSAYWQPEALDNNKILYNSEIKTNSDYRKYMTHKGNIIRDHNNRSFTNY